MQVHLTDIRYTPNSLLNMIFEDLLERRGIFWRGKLKKFIHLGSGKEFASVTKMNGLKVFSVQPILYSSSLSSMSSPQCLDINILHKRLGHLHVDGVRETVHQNGWKLTNSCPLFCDACYLAKSNRIIY